MKLSLAFTASRCDHNLPTQPGCLYSLPHPLVPANWAVQCPQTWPIFAPLPWLTYPLYCPHLKWPLLLSSTFQSILVLWSPAQSLLPPWCLTWCPQLEVTSPSDKCVCSSVPLGWQLKPSFYISHLATSSSLLLPEGMNHVWGIFVSPTVSISVPGKWYLKDICWIEEWGC